MEEKAIPRGAIDKEAREKRGLAVVCHKKLNVSNALSN
jgi:hypothetical protein